MSEDLTKNNQDIESERLTLILNIVIKLDKHETILTLILDRLDKLTSGAEASQIRLYAIDARLESLERTIKRSVDNLESGHTVFNDAIRKINIGFLDVNERLQRLELPNKPSNSQT
jgi:hypothetical protein